MCEWRAERTEEVGLSVIAAGSVRSRLTAEMHRDETTIGGRSCSRRSLVCVGPLRHLMEGPKEKFEIGEGAVPGRQKVGGFQPLNMELFWLEGKNAKRIAAV